MLEFFYGGSTRREDGMSEDMEEELEWFDEPPSFNDLCIRLKAKFGGDFTLKRRFDSGKTRAHCPDALARPCSLVPLQ